MGNPVALIRSTSQDILDQLSGLYEQTTPVPDWEEVGENGGKLWELYRGSRYDHIIIDVKIAPGGKSLLIKTAPEHCVIES